MVKVERRASIFAAVPGGPLSGATRRVLLGALQVVGCLLLAAATVRSQEEPPIELIHADRVSLERTEAGNTYVATGLVHFRQGRSELHADRAVWYEEKQEIQLFGQVRVLDTAESIACDTLHYYSATDRAFAYGHVEYRKPADDLVARSQRGTYDRSLRRALLYDEASMVQHENNPGSRIETEADTLDFSSLDHSGAARGHVRVTREDGRITSQAARFVSGDSLEHVVFTGEPSGSFGGSEVQGDTVTVNLQNQEMRSLSADGKARARFQESAGKFGRTTTSDISADWMVLQFRGGQLRELLAVGQAKSRYVPAWGRPGERNDASGDTVKITMADSTVQRVQVISGAVGTYLNPQGDSLTARVDTIDYQSSYIDYRVDLATIRLWDHAELHYGDVHLAAGQVVYQTDLAILRAYSVDDTLLPAPADYSGPAELPDSLEAAGVTPAPPTPPAPEEQADFTAPAAASTWRQYPVLREGSELVDGQRLVYDINTRRGRIVHSSTAAQDGYYSGGDFRLESAKTFYVENGQYTTCELDPPHFSFTGGKMKVREKDRVIARPVVMRIEQIPVLWLPYYVFSIKPDRHSGMLPLRFGNFERGSRFVRNIGYYFAASEYWDIAPALDIVEGEGVLWHVLTSYALRYKLSGSLFGSYNKHTAVVPTGEQTTTRWNLLFAHNQQISPSLTLAGSGNFVSDNSFYQDFTADPNFRLNRRLRSTVNLNKRWQSSSLILAAEDARNLDDDSRESILPRYALALPQRQLFTQGKLKGGALEPARWYHQLRAGFNSVGQNLISESVVGTSRRGKHYITADHRFDVNYSGKAGPITLTPGMNVEETWYYVYAPKNDSLVGGIDSLPAGIESEHFYRRLSGSFRLSSQTNLYGIFNVNSGGLLGFRHVFTPSLSLSFAPAVTENQAVRLYTGVGGGGARSTLLGIGLGNLFQMKTRSGDTERNWDLLNVGVSTSYNFEAKSHQLSQINTSLRSGLIRNPDLSLSLVHDPYDPVTGEFDLTPRLAAISTAVTFRLAGRGGVPGGSSVGQGGYYATEGGADIEGRGGSLGGFGNGSRQVRSWDFAASYQFSETRTPEFGNPQNTQKSITHWIRPNLRFNPTPNWDVQTNLYYDIRNQIMNDWTIRLQRDLHCWEAEFTWVVTGARAGYYFRINVKRISALKFEKNVGGLKDALFGALPGT